MYLVSDTSVELSAYATVATNVALTYEIDAEIGEVRFVVGARADLEIVLDKSTLDRWSSVFAEANQALSLGPR